MVGTVTVRTFGFRELEQKLRQLPNRTRKAVLVRTLRKAAPMVVNVLRANAPRGLTGHLAASPAAGTKLTRHQAAQDAGTVKSTAQLNIGIAADGTTGVTQYAALTEFYNRGTTGWFTRGWESTRGLALEVIKVELAAAIDKSLARGSGARG
ncbi:MAG: hypothetical protein QOH47_810 [Sphingomonadales bacterium]|jgi:hypothetical protein|nr:hypothetical protein [Sphingomonadales bacterium]